MQTGIYEVTSNVKIRREPRIVEGKTTNQVGLLTIGTQRRIYSTITNPDNSTWGRVSEADAAGIAEWVCIKGLNRTYMKLIEPDIFQSEKDRLSILENEFSRLKNWARKELNYPG